MRVRVTKKLFGLLIVLALVLAFIPTAIAAQDEQINLEGSVVSGDVLQLVFYSSAAPTPSVENITLEIEGNPVALKSVNPISFADPGTSYIFLLDTNTAVSERALSDMKTIVRTMVDKMGVQDNVLITPMGAEIDERNFTDDSPKLSAQIEALQKGNEPQDLYASMYNALKLLSESNGLRARKCLVVIADGLDGQISGISEMELANLVEKAQIPVYIVALTYNTKTDARVEAAKTVTSFARMSPGGLSILLTPGGAEDAANQILSQREKTFLAVVAADAVRTATSAEQANVKLSLTTDKGVISSTRNISLVALTGAKPTTEPASGQVQQSVATPLPTASPTSARTESSILSLLKRLPPWAYIVTGAVVVCVIALIVIISSLKRRRIKKEGMVVRFDTSSAKHFNPDGPEICLIQLGDQERLCCEMQMPNQLVIGGDKKRAQLPMIENPTIAPAQCRLIWKNGSIWVEEMSKRQRTELNGVPINQSTPVKTGDVLRLGSFDYRVFWEKH